MNRMVWMDAFRGFCILLVIMVHAYSVIFILPFEVEGSETLKKINNYLSPFRMPALMFLSGYLFSKSFKKGPKKFFVGKFNNILWPYIVWTPIALYAMHQLTLTNLAYSVIVPRTFLWFLWFLFAYYCVLYLIERFKINYYLVIFTCILGVMFMPDVVRIPRFFFLFMFFLFGHLSCKYALQFKINKYILFGAIIVFLSQLTFVIMNNQDIRYTLMYMPLSASFILIVMYFSRFYKTNILNSSLEYIGRNSIFYFVMHLPIQLVISEYLLSNGYNIHFVFLFNIIIPVITATCITFLSQRNNLIDYFFRLKL